MNKTVNPCTITIGPVRFSYLAAFEPKAFEGSAPKYSVSAIIPKSDKKTIQQIEKAVELAKQNGKDKVWKGKIPSKLKLPLRDGDEDRPEDEAYQKSMFINCHNKTRPGLVDVARNSIVNQDELKSGDYGYLNITLYPFGGVSNGIAASFNHLMKTKTGEALSGRISVDAAFENIEVEEDNEDVNNLM